MNRKESKLKFSLNGLTPVLDFLHARIVQRSRKTATPHFVFGTPFLQTNCSGLCDRSPSSLIGSVGSIFSLPGLAIAPSVRKSATRISKFAIKKLFGELRTAALPCCERSNAFTLAEVLITLGVIGIVAAVTMPTLLTNIQERVRKEQVRTVKYKLTKATDKMNSLGKIKQYDTTMDFVNELKKHMTIAKICKNNELDKCWPSTEINAYSGSGTTLTSYNPKNLQTGQSLKALALSTKNTQTVGIVTGDGVPMLIVYSPSAHCNDFDEAKTYTWSVEDGKPVTNATTNCISAIFDINGAKGPNKIGTDVRTLNSLFGSTNLGISDGVGIDICNKMKQKYGFQYCDGGYTIASRDRWVGGIYECDKLGLHLPNMQTLANIANARYGTTQIGTYTLFMKKDDNIGSNCAEWIKNNWDQGKSWRIDGSDAIICDGDTTTDTDSSLNVENSNLSSVDAYFWSNSEISQNSIQTRRIVTSDSSWHHDIRDGYYVSTLCVGD